VRSRLRPPALLRADPLEMHVTVAPAGNLDPNMTDTASSTERRANPHLRAVFVEAYDLLAPFFDPANAWGGKTHEHLAYRALHERFPDMSAEDVFIMVAAAKRVFGSGGRPASP